MAKVCAVLPGQTQQKQQLQTPAPVPPRRPRVREVSSRFMSPIVTSGDLHLPSSKHATLNSSASNNHHHNQPRSHSAQRRESQSTEGDENRNEMMIRSSDTPLGTFNRQVNTMHQQQRRKGVRLFKENGGSVDQQNCNNMIPMRSGNLARSRPDTPVAQLRSSVNFSVTAAASTAAAKLVQMNGMGTSNKIGNPVSDGSSDFEVVSENILDSDVGCAENVGKVSLSSVSSEVKTFSITDQEGRYSSPVRVQSSKMRSLPDFRSSMPETDLLPNIASKFLAHNRDTPKVNAFSCYRSLNSPLPSCEQSFLGVGKFVHRPLNGVSLPPQPSNAKVGIEGRKAKVSNHLEQVHALRMLQNRYLQWRYANAKAEAAMNAQSTAANRSLYALAKRITDLHDSVNKKHAELRQLKKERTLSSILEAQLPYLDEWSTLEDDYSTSLGGAIKALQDASLRLPVTGNVRADNEEVGRALNSASNVMEHMSSFVESFLPKGEDMDNMISELSGVISRERALIEECGDVLSRTHILQGIYNFMAETFVLFQGVFIDHSMVDAFKESKLVVADSLAQGASFCSSTRDRICHLFFVRLKPDYPAIRRLIEFEKGGGFMLGKQASSRFINTRNKLLLFHKGQDMPSFFLKVLGVASDLLAQAYAGKCTLEHCYSDADAEQEDLVKVLDA
ncbi:hypothetical protein IFM89_011331 [Coptis chinensis]|uniref:Uncharacterized protein n=1 Tax=Coptis chinensis TaxID=261450 RepID=A0A835IUM2_9MAGN|nr:hypothetical protein IFM89_011331 [Coptis chinensis]